MVVATKFLSPLSPPRDDGTNTGIRMDQDHDEKHPALVRSPSSDLDTEDEKPKGRSTGTSISESESEDENHCVDVDGIRITNTNSASWSTKKVLSWGDDNSTSSHDGSKSIESMMSDWNEEVEPEEHYATREDRLECLFEMRDEILDRIADGKDQDFVRLLRMHEQLVRNEALKLRDTDTGTGITTSQDGKSKVSDTKTGCLRSLLDLSLFESRTTLQGFVTFVGYCSFHMAAYELVFAIIADQSYKLQMNQDFINGGLLFLCLLVNRATGGVWDWVSSRTHEVAKFEFHNRIRLGYVDAKIHRWFRKHKNFKFFLDYLTIYIGLTSTSHFHTRLMQVVAMDKAEFINTLPSRQYGLDTPVALYLQNKMMGECSEVDQQCSLISRLNTEDDEFIFRTTSMHTYSQLLGDEEALVMQKHQLYLFFLALSMASFYVLQKLSYVWGH